MLGLVAPVTMSTDQCAIWIASAEDALAGIWPAEVEAVSMEVRRTVTRPSQIVPEIARLVAERRAEHSRHQRIAAEDEAYRKMIPPKRHIADRDRKTFGPEDWAELNTWLESQGATARYHADGTRYTVPA